MAAFPALAFALALGCCWLLRPRFRPRCSPDRPPPVPPASVPDAPTAPAMNLAPPGGDPDPAADLEPADHRAAVDRHRPAGCAAAGASRSGSGGAVADGALRQGSAGHQWRAGVAGVRRQARRHRHVQADPRGARRDPEHRAAARQLRRPRRARPGQRGAGGEPESGDRSRVLRASGRRPAHRGPRRHQQDSAEPDFVRALQGQPVRRRRRRRTPVAGAQRRRAATSRCCRRGPTTSSPTTATPIPWCAPTSACRPAS